MLNFNNIPQWFFGGDGNHLPTWFIGNDAWLQFIFAAVTFLLAFVFYRAYRVNKDKQTLLSSVGFLLISLAYGIWSFLNLNIMVRMMDFLCNIVAFCEPGLNSIAIYLHIGLFTSGLLIITLIPLQIRKRATVFLIAILIFSTVIMSSNSVYVFLVVSTILFSFTTYNHIRKYMQSHNNRILLIILGFGFVTLGYIVFIGGYKDGTHYLLGNYLELIGYIILFVNMIRFLFPK